MAEVKFSVEGSELGQGGKAMEFHIKDDSGKIGSLRISRGALYWRAANKQKEKRYSWSQFAALMEEKT